MAETTSVTKEELLRLGEELLNEDGQIELSLKLEDGDVRGSQEYLLGAADACMQRGLLTEAEAPQVMARIGLSMRDRERIRSRSPDKLS